MLVVYMNNSVQCTIHAILIYIYIILYIIYNIVCIMSRLGVQYLVNVGSFKYSGAVSYDVLNPHKVGASFESEDMPPTFVPFSVALLTVEHII